MRRLHRFTQLVTTPMAVNEGFAEVQMFLRQGDLVNAMRGAAQLRRSMPNSAHAHQISGDIALRRFDWEIAERFYRGALELDGGLWHAMYNLANICRYTDRRKEWTYWARQAIARCSDPTQAARLHSNLLIHMHSDSTADHACIIAELDEWRALHLGDCPVSFPIRLPATRERPLIAFVSGAFASSIFLRLLPNVLRELSRSRFRVELVNTGPTLQAHTRYADDQLTWVNSADFDVLRKRGYSVAVDLDGHSPTGTLRLFAQRIAPVQVCWLDWFNSTGVPSMDFFIGDAISTPPSLHATFCERVVMLPQFRLCFEPPEFAAQLPLPAVAGDCGVTFGVFGRFDKYNTLLYDIWADILRRSAGSKMLFKATAFSSPALRQHVVHRFNTRGVAVERLHFLGTTDYRAHLELHARLNLMLDTLPYNGGVSSFDSLLCGVPVLTCVGDHPASRQTASMLRAVGLDEYVADSAADYVERALLLSSRPIHTGSEIRRRFLASELVDSRRFATSLVHAFDQMLGPAF